jgi:hypothetical protein
MINYLSLNTPSRPKGGQAMSEKTVYLSGGVGDGRTICR